MTDLKDIKAFAFDIDGVMTDGGILADLEGQLYRTYDAKDGFAVRMAAMNGFPVGVITGARSQSVRARFSGNGIPPEDVYLGSRDKITDCDDVPDIPVLLAAGIGVVPSDGVDEAKEAADIVSDRPGGKCCVRRHIEQVMRAQGKWNFDVNVYKSRF